MNEFEKILRAIAKRILNLTDAQVDSILYEDAEKTKLKASAVADLLKKDEERISAADAELKRVEKEKLDEGYNKGKKESLGVLENTLKDKYGVKESSKLGAELVEEIVTARVAAASKKGEITEELIKSTDFYLKESKEWDKKFTDLKTENETKLKEFENANKEKLTLESVRKKAIELFKGLNPILSEDAAKSERQIEQFVKEVLSGKKFKIEGEGEDMTITILDEKGAPKKDSHGHLVKFEDSIKNTATDLYDFKAAEDRDAPNNDTDKDKPKPGDKKDNKDKKWTGQVPKTQDEYLKVVAELEKKGDNEGMTLLTKAVEQAGVIKFNKS